VHARLGARRPPCRARLDHRPRPPPRHNALASSVIINLILEP
jgi:hypothetical protein